MKKKTIAVTLMDSYKQCEIFFANGSFCSVLKFLLWYTSNCEDNKWMDGSLKVLKYSNKDDYSFSSSFPPFLLPTFVYIYSEK